MSDYSPDPIPGLETEHPAQVRTGLVAPEHDRPERSGLDIDMLGIRAAIYRYRHHKHSFGANQPPGPELHDMLVESYDRLEGQDDPSSAFLRRQIVELIPALRDRGFTDTERLELVMGHYKITRDLIDKDLDLHRELRNQQR
jgi:hypothetical protein